MGKEEIELSMQRLMHDAWLMSGSRSIELMARKAVGDAVGHSARIRSVIDGIPDPSFLIVAACAMALQIPCRPVAHRYGDTWTVRLAYPSVDGTSWVVVDCSGRSTDALHDEEVFGPELGNPHPPSAVVLWDMPLVGTMGRLEREVAAAFIVRALQVRGSDWGPIAVSDVLKTLADEAEAGRTPAKWWAQNPFVRPDFRDLVRSGYARWFNEQDKVVELTDRGRNVLRMWVKDQDKKKKDRMLHFFRTSHLKPELAEVVVPFGELAQRIVDTLPRNAERTAALRKLLEAKDCAVRALICEETDES